MNAAVRRMAAAAALVRRPQPRPRRPREPGVGDPLRDDLDHVLLDVAYTDGSSERYQVIVRLGLRADRRVQHGRDHRHRRRPHRLRRALRPGRRAVPAVADRRGATVGRHALQPRAGRRRCRWTRAPRVSDAEQSNTSVIFDEEAILKVFRRVHAGHQPGHRAEPGARPGRQPARGPAARRRSRPPTDGEPCPLGMVTEYAANSAEGWAMATASARDLFAEARPARRRGGRRLRRRVVPARRGGRVGAPHARRGAGHVDRRRSRSTRCWRGCRPRRRRCPSWQQYVPPIEERYRKLAERDDHRPAGARRPAPRARCCGRRRPGC